MAPDVGWSMAITERHDGTATTPLPPQPGVEQLVRYRLVPASIAYRRATLGSRAESRCAIAARSSHAKHVDAEDNDQASRASSATPRRLWSVESA